MLFSLDSSGNPVTQQVVGVTDSSGNPVTGLEFFHLHIVILHWQKKAQDRNCNTMNKYWFLIKIYWNILDANGNPVTQSVISVTDSSGNSVTGIYCDSWFIIQCSM